jgi:hypothetical protein
MTACTIAERGERDLTVDCRLREAAGAPDGQRVLPQHARRRRHPAGIALRPHADQRGRDAPAGNRWVGTAHPFRVRATDHAERDGA